MLIQSANRCVTKIAGKVPFRLVLTVPFVLQISAVVGLVGYLSFRNEQVDNILDLAKLKNHKLELQLRSVGIKAIAEVVLTVCQHLIGNKNLQLINAVPADFPLATE
jgi:hypothetical protein